MKFWKFWQKRNQLDQLLEKAKGCKTVLIPWNRGMGDIALGLYPIVQRIYDFIPEAKVTFLIRPDLQEGFQLFKGVDVIVAPDWVRGKPTTLPKDLPHFDLVIENADPSKWMAWARGKIVPKMEWEEKWDELCERFHLPQGCIAAHVHCETGYYFERNWPKEKWDELFSSLSGPIVLFGLKKEPIFQHENIFDLRGETSLLEILSIVKNRCHCLIAPDSGILGLTYYLNVAFPIKVVSIWADPHHGILKQNVSSPNPLLQHVPVISPDRKNAALIPVEEVRKALC